MAEGDFMLIRPYCLLLVEEPTRSSVEALAGAVRQIDRHSLQQMQEYVLLPLSGLIFGTDRSQEVVVDAICCIKDVISLTQVKSWNVFLDVAFQVVRTISNVDKDSSSPVVEDVSDELKQAVVSCLMMLVDKSSDSILNEIYGDKFLPRLGHIIYVLLHLSEHDTCRQTRLLSMECLKMLGKGLRVAKIRKKAKDSLASFIPGISVTLTKIGTESGLSGQAIIVGALNLWIALIFEVFDDEQFDSGELNNPTDETEEENGKSTMKVQGRTERWVKTASEKIAILSQKMSVLEGFSKWNVRCALAEWAGNLLSKCKRSLVDSIPACLGILITLTADDYPVIKEVSQKHLHDFGSKLSTNERSLIETLQENLLELVVQLPAIFRHSGDAKKLSTLDRLNGYLNTLGPSLNVVLNSASHLEKLSFGLLHLSEIDCRNVSLIYEKAIRSDASPIDDFVENPPPKIRRRFLHFDDERIQWRIIQICRTLGKFGNLQLLVDHFIERFHESSIYRKQALLLLNDIIAGASSQPQSIQKDSDRENVYSIIRGVVEEYTDASIWDVKVSLDAENVSEREGIERRLVVAKPVKDESISVLNSNSFQTCLLLEGIGSCAQVLGEKFNPLLMPVLYNVLEKLGSANALVSHSAFLTLLQITNSCKYSSIADLILKNADYLLNNLSIKLKYNPRDYKGPVVLRVTLERCDKQMLDLSKDIVDELLENLDIDHEFNLTLHLNVLYTLVKAILKWFPPKQVSKTVGNRCSSSKENKLSVCEFIKEYHEAKVKAEDSLEMDDKNCDSETPNSADEECASKADVDKKQKSPTYVQMIVQILERCCHLLPSKSQTQALLVLEIVNVSAVVLQEWEDDLLPMVHKIWAPLSLRFTQDNLLVTKMAFATLCTLASVCGDFVRRDALKDVWPKILLFLDKQLPLSLNREGTAYQYTAGYKLLLDVLSSVGTLAETLDIPDLELDNLASATVLYLGCRQPVDVQTAAVKLFQQLTNVNPDLIWLKLVDVYNDPEHLLSKPEDSEFRPVKVFGQYSGNAEYRKNVLSLLEFMDNSETSLRFG